MECLRSPPGPFDYLITEQAKSLVALQELQNEVGALLEFRDLVIETFPNLRSKMAPSTPASSVRRDWEPGVRVRRKLAGGASDSARAKPQPSVQDSGFSTETSCGKDASASATASTSRSRPVEDELWALLDVIQRKGLRIRDEAELLRGELDERHSPAAVDDTAEESFVRALSAGCAECTCNDARRLRRERDALLARSAELEAAVATRLAESSPGSPPATSTPPPHTTPLGRLDHVLDTPLRPLRVATPPSKKFAAILQESNPVELQRQLLTSTVQAQVLSDRLRRAAAQRAALLERLERTREENDDLKFQLEEKSIELEGTKARVRMFEGKQKSNNDGETSALPRSREHSSMRDMEPLQMPDTPAGDSAEARIAETPRRGRPSRIPLHTAAHKGAAPKPPVGRAPIARDSVPYRSRSGESPARPPSAHSCRSHRHSLTRTARNDSYNSVKKDSATGVKKTSSVPVRRTNTPQREENKKCRQRSSNKAQQDSYHDSLNFVNLRCDSEEACELITEYLARTDRPVHNHLLFSRLSRKPLPLTTEKSEYRLAYENPQNLALELSKSVLYENSDSIDVGNLNLNSLNSHGESKQYSEDSLWNGKPQQYFESMNSAGKHDENIQKHYDQDSLIA